MKITVVLAVLVLALVLVIGACGGESKVEPPALATQKVGVSPDIPLLTAIDYDLVDVVEQHMAYGTDPNDVFIPPKIPFEGASALHLAVLKSNAPIVEVLLDNGANIEIKARDAFKATPLIWAAYWGIPEMVRLLLEAGANVNAEDTNGFTPLDAAGVENPFIAKEDAETFIRSRAEIRELLKEHGGRSGRYGNE